MAGRPHHHLQINPIGQSFRLHGLIDGKRIRIRSRNRVFLENKKAELERDLLAKQPKATDKALRSTWLDEDQLRRAEEATKLSRGRSLIDLVREAMAIAPDLDPVEWDGEDGAVAQYEAHQRRLHRYEPTIKNNKRRLRAFFEAAKVIHMGDVTAAAIERHVLRAGVAPRTQISDGVVLRAFFRWATEKALIAHTPFTVNLRSIGTKKHDEDRQPKILTPAQCAALAAAAAEMYSGDHLPYLGRALWCMMRHGEAVRTPVSQLLRHGKVRMFQVFSRKRGTVSTRTVNVPANVLAWVKRPVVFTDAKWDNIRERAGLIERAPAEKRGGARKHVRSDWAEHILRHTGMSYFHQRHGNDVELARQAGDTPEVAHANYIRLPKPGDADKFYAVKAP